MKNQPNPKARTVSPALTALLMLLAGLFVPQLVAQPALRQTHPGIEQVEPHREKEREKWLMELLSSKKLSDDHREVVSSLWLKWKESGKLQEPCREGLIYTSLHRGSVDEARARSRALYLDAARADVLRAELDEVAGPPLVPGEAAESLRLISDQLSEKHLRALSLRAQGYTHREIAEVMGENHTAVRKWFSDVIYPCLKGKSAYQKESKQKNPRREKYPPTNIIESSSEQTAYC